LLQTVSFENAALAKQGFAQHWPLTMAHTDPQFACGLHNFVGVFRYTKLFRQQAEVTTRRVRVTVVAVGKAISITQNYLFTDECTSELS
jgi:hypothetical protein